jgi:hypothetical protein
MKGIYARTRETMHMCSQVMRMHVYMSEFCILLLVVSCVHAGGTSSSLTFGWMHAYASLLLFASNIDSSGEYTQGIVVGSNQYRIINCYLRLTGYIFSRRILFVCGLLFYLLSVVWSV